MYRSAMGDGGDKLHFSDEVIVMAFHGCTILIAIEISIGLTPSQITLQ
jgi:hypothetical protein